MSSLEKTNELIPVYYSYDPDCDEISISGKDYADFMECFADGANGEDGVVYPRFHNEPYNYFREINDAMWDLDFEELSEGVFSTEDYTLQDVIDGMREKGFEMIECDW